MMSSISCVIGTAGQSNYAAANGYMGGLARRRRRRGLAASALDLGVVLGVGVAEASGQRVVDSLQKYGITHLSEVDLRFGFAESIVAGRVSSRDAATIPGHGNAIPAAVITPGLRSISSREQHITWYNNPIFSHLVLKAEASEEDRTKSKAAAVPLKDQIAHATNRDEALHSLKGKKSSQKRGPAECVVKAGMKKD